MPDRISAREALRSHLPEYPFEAWALGTFMFVARAVGCAKLRHTSDQPCIHCGYAP
jgi:hypothetical protein